MNFACERDALLRALDHAQRIVVRKDAVSILATVMIEVTEGRVTIRATNLDMLAETWCPADVTTPGAGCVALEPLFKLLQRLPAGAPVTAEAVWTAGHLAIRCRRSAVELPLLRPGEFPDFPLDADAAEIEIEGAVLARAMGVPLHAADPEDQRAFVQGVCVGPTSDGTHLLGIATNGRRITRALLPLPAGAAAMPVVMVAVKPAEEIIRLARSASTLRLRINDRLFSAEGEGARIVTKLLDARMPETRQHFPASLGRTVEISAGDIADTLGRAEVLADDKYRAITLEVADGELSLVSRSTKGGAITDTIEVEGGDGIRFCANVKMLREALAAVGGDVVAIHHAGPGHPIIVQAKGCDEITALVMPTVG